MFVPATVRSRPWPFLFSDLPWANPVAFLFFLTSDLFPSGEAG